MLGPPGAQGEFLGAEIGFRVEELRADLWEAWPPADAQTLTTQVATGAAVEEGGDLAWGGRRSRWRCFSGEQIQGPDYPGGAASEHRADSEAEYERDAFLLTRPRESYYVVCPLVREILRALPFLAAGRARLLLQLCWRAGPLAVAGILSPRSAIRAASPGCMSQSCAESRQNGGRCYFGITSI